MKNAGGPPWRGKLYMHDTCRGRSIVYYTLDTEKGPNCHVGKIVLPHARCRKKLEKSQAEGIDVRNLDVEIWLKRSEAECFVYRTLDAEDG